MRPSATIRVLDNREMMQMHEAALRILARTGLQFSNIEGLELLRANSVRVDMDLRRVYLDDDAVLETIRQFAGVARLAMSDSGVEHPDYERRLVDRLSGSIGSNHGFLYDIETRQVEAIDYASARRMLRIKQALPGVDAAAPGFLLQNVPSPVASVHTAALAVIHGCHHGPGISHKEEWPWITRVLDAACLRAGGEEYYESPVALSPLLLGGYLADVVVERGKRGLLTKIDTAPTKGASSPVTVAGDLTLRVAETFGFNTLSRLLCSPEQTFHRPVMNSDAISMDMRHASINVFAPELMLMTAAYMQMMGDFYKSAVQLPIYLVSNGAHPDVQAGMERVSGALMRLLLGAGALKGEVVTGVVDLGVVGRNMALCLEQAVIDHAYMGFLQRYLEGVRVTDDTIAADVIDEVGPGGNFLAEEHTVRHHVAETWYSDTYFPQEYDAWVAEGRPTDLDRARRKVDALCAEELLPSLPDDRVRAVHQVVREAERAILGHETGLLP